VRVYYEDHGAGPAILLSHGYSATSAMWAPQVEALARRHRVVTWDLRGHGASDSPDDPALYSHELAVEDMASLLDRLGIERAVIAGLSLGGYLSLAFSARYPARTRALILMDTGPGFKSDEARSRWNDTAERTARRFEVEGLAALPARREVSAGRHRDALGLARAARGLLVQRDDAVIRSLPAIGVPALVLVGSDDAPFLSAASYMAGKIPGAKHVIVPGAGHAANLDQPELVNRELVEFLETLDRATDVPGRRPTSPDEEESP
jgi:pimeloyl-ACP methyl ester carboxylesterase